MFKTQSLQLLPPPPSPAWNERKPANWQWPFLFTHSKLIPEYTVMQLLCRAVERFALKSLSSSFILNCRTDPSVSQKHHPGVLQSGTRGGPEVVLLGSSKTPHPRNLARFFGQFRQEMNQGEETFPSLGTGAEQGATTTQILISKVGSTAPLSS